MMELKDYQVESRDQLLARKRFGLFDEMGVGKTAPTLMAAAKTGEQTLVTAPAYLLTNWAREIAKWLPGATIGHAYGDGERSKRQATLEASTADFVLTPYHSWHSYPVLQKRRWGNLVFDEAHRIRGRNSQWTQKLYATQNAESKSRDSRFWFLTGTPLVRDAGDLYPFLHMMDRQIYRSYWSFVERHCHLTRTPWETIIGDVLDPEDFRRTLDMWSMRRLQTDIPELASLEAIDRDLWVDLPPSVVKAMKVARTEYVISHPDMEEDLFYDGAGGLIAKLRVMATLPPTESKPKMKAFSEFLEDAPADRIVAFSWYRETAAAMVAACEKQRRPVRLITGDVRASARVQAVDDYDADPRMVLVGTISAMKEGLNLQAGRHCVFLEESELPSDNEQAIGRLKRFGQKQPVTVTRIGANGSLDVVTHKNVGKRETSIRKAMMEYAYSP